MPWRPRPIHEAAQLFWSILNPTLGDDRCWEWPKRRQHHGHGLFRLTFEDREERATHRIAWRLTRGGIPIWLNVLHKCGNAPCCRPSHLYLGTDKDNVRDAYTIHHTGRWSHYVKLRWATHFDACITCGTTTIEHGDHEMCRHCAANAWRARNHEHAKEIARLATRRYRARQKLQSP